MIHKPIRLFWGENYAEKPEVVKTAIDKAVQETILKIHLYPGSLYQDAINLIAKSLGVEENQVILGHGIEGLIHITTSTFLDLNKVGAMFHPSFFVFENNLQRYKHVYYPVHYDKKVTVEDLLNNIRKTDLFFLASPNTATGNYLLSRDEIEKLLNNYSGLLVVDECYYGIGNQTVIDLIKRHDNLLIYRGVTKVMGMGSLRLGFAISQKYNIDRLKYHLTDIELDPINSFSLQIFKATFLFYDLLATNTKAFFNDFYLFMRKKFPGNKIVKTVTTFYFMDIRDSGKQACEVINLMNKSGFLMSSSELKDNSTINFPEFIQLTPPPKEYWEDFSSALQKALTQ